MGPTASGKTALALELAQQLPCEIISVDSAMVYRGMDIGTAKPTPAELTHAPHHLLDILDPSESYSAGQFRNDASRVINQIIAKGRIPLLVGGTMMYFRALQQGLSPLPQADIALRQRLNIEAATLGWSMMHQRLLQVDPVAGQRISPNDSQRIQRALEVYELTGMPLTEFCERNKITPPPYNFVNIGLVPNDRARLKERIELRFKGMLEHGFIEEVMLLRQRADLHADLPALRAVGYRQVWDYLEGKLTWEGMENCGIVSTKHLAKRQLTWLQSWPNLSMLYCEDPLLTAKFLALWKANLY